MAPTITTRRQPASAALLYSALASVAGQCRNVSATKQENRTPTFASGSRKNYLRCRRAPHSPLAQLRAHCAGLEIFPRTPLCTTRSRTADKCPSRDSPPVRNADKVFSLVRGGREFRPKRRRIVRR